MTGAQANGIKRKSLRHAHDPDEDAPPAKKPKAPPASKNASQNTLKQKSKKAYDEDDDGFSFSRARSRKAKTKAPPIAPEPDATTAAAPEAGVQASQEQPPSADQNAHLEPTQPPRKKPRKTLPTTPEHSAPRRRSKRLSGNSPINEQAAATSKPVPPPSEPRPRQTKPTTPPPAPAPVNDENAAPTGHSPSMGDGELTVHKKRGPAKIPLPFGETPVLRRNKEMRKLSAEKSRRSSSGMRGRRASSLIEAGSSHEDFDFNIEETSDSQKSNLNQTDFESRQDRSSGKETDDDEAHFVKVDEADWNDSVGAAVPHSQVETPEFYKHISQDLVEPKRMRQLLMWSGHRALPEKSSGGQMDAAETAAMHAARVIQEELLNEFGTRNNMSYWYDREDTVPTVLVKKPNPKNIQGAERLQQLEAELSRLQEEKRSWDELLASTSTPKDSEAETEASSQMQIDLDATAINPSLLDPSQAETLQTLLSNISLNSNISTAPPTSTLENTRQRIGNIASSLEFKIDRLADGAHKLEQYRASAHRLADRVLEVGAEKLEQRDRELRERNGGESVDALDRLRGLSRVLGKKG